MTDRYNAAGVNRSEEQVMDLKPGDVVMLKSGGHSLCVAEVNEDAVECVWMGNEGELYRETLPVAVLELVESDESEDEEDDHEEDEDEDENEDEEEDEKDEHDKVA
jgi:uncharacterized protein YodC (DUF2158 family)